MISKANPGEKILPAYNALVEEIKSWRTRPGEGVRIFETPMGTIISRMPEPVIWNNPFKVSLNNSSISVAPGRMNSNMVYMDKRPLDGLDDEGKPIEEGVPSLDLKEQKKEADRWVVLRARADKEWKLKNKEVQTIEITDTQSWLAGYSAAIKDEDSKEGGWHGDFPIGLIRKDRVWQLAHFHIRCRVQQVAEGKGRFWFFV